MTTDNADYETIVKLINNIFINVDKDISKSIFDNYKIITRQTKLSFKDTLIYSLEYTQNHKTKIDIVNKFNKDIDDSKNIISRTTFHEKDSIIPLSYYVSLHIKLIDIYRNEFTNKSKTTVISVDGTYANTNIKNIKGYLETSLSMGFFDVTNDIPIELIFKGEESKNKEVASLQNYIANNKNKLKNVIFVLDRAYCSYKFIDFCSKNQIKYVIRFRNNCINISKTNRIIKFNEVIYDVIKNDKIDKHLINNKKFTDVTLKTKNEYTLITNLNINDYNNEKIKEIYHQRWNIEVFFKIIKYNFKFSDLKITNLEQNNDNYSIHNIKILIIYLLGKIMEKVHLQVKKIKLNGIIKKRNFKNRKIKNNNVIKKEKKITKKQQNELNEIPIINTDITNNNKIILEDKKPINKINNINKDENKRDCILKPCITNIIKGVFVLINEIGNGKLTLKTYSNVANRYIKYYKIDPTIHNKRICKTPFKKWYIKGYTNKSDNVKIVNFILGFSTKKLNKNLIVKLNNSIIVNINYMENPE
jgi:hypothetical protein